MIHTGRPVDLHYWATNNSEWYDPAAVTTGNGSRKITLSKTETHNLSAELSGLSRGNLVLGISFNYSV
ncbi:hypothetical protein C8F04DRAFT_1084679 [Mycena alexandri]|uniref:Uncharacterized protein n=1 Tax=Mycena alexandri TaxID=1745969 RepID=A0AAD6X8X1_9AGAR|nr:hypothetical protein C8F04DRAFT_1084679 [Mycena alexandri]